MSPRWPSASGSRSSRRSAGPRTPPASRPGRSPRSRASPRLLEALRTVHEGGSGVAGLLEAVVEQTGYLAELRKSQDPQDETRVENLAELVAVAREFDEAEPEGSLEDFLEQVSLVADADQIPDGDEAEDAGVVTLMTLHTAKGLEFPVVFLTGMEDGTFPHLRALGDPKELEEERRLAYVGITRARERLHLSRAAVRSAWGAAAVQPGLAGSSTRSRPTWSTGSAPSATGVAAVRPPRPWRPSPARPGVRSPGNRPVIALAAGDRVTHDSFGLGTRGARRGRRRQGAGPRRLRRRHRRQAVAAALRAAGEALAARTAPVVTGAVGVRLSTCCAGRRYCRCRGRAARARG